MSPLFAILANRRVVLIGLGAAVLLALMAIALPIVTLFEYQAEDIQDSLNQLATYHAETAARPAIEASMKSALARAASAPGLLQSPSAALAQAELQSDFKSIAGQTGAEIRSAQILPATKTNGFDVIAIQYDLTVPASRLRDLAYAVEAHAPYLFIDDATINAQASWQAGATGAQDPALELRWTVRGYRWNGAP